MSGIVGFCGRNEALPVLLAGLRRLEPRGYDSVGIATVNDGKLHIQKLAGRVDQLAEELQRTAPAGQAGIAHTRWATHGRPSWENAHPLTDQAGRIALVHNGIIENHEAIRGFLQSQGVRFVSETDTESLAQLLGFFYQQTGDLLASLRGALSEVRGPFGIALVCRDAPGLLLAARRGGPLYVGSTPTGTLLASDPDALSGQVPQPTPLQDGEIVCITPEGWSASPFETPSKASVSAEPARLASRRLDGFAHHMLKEIYEQPEALRNALRGRVQEDADRVTLGGLRTLQRQLPHFRRALLFGCGTSWHASLVGRQLLEELAGLPAEVEYASELRYRNPLIEEQTFGIAVSQSGETADTLAALREVRDRGATTLGVVNVVGSTISRETDAGIYLHAGPEIGVASTKAFSCQVMTLALLALDLGRRRRLSPERTQELIAAAQAVPAAVEQALTLRRSIARLAERLADQRHWLFLGRGIDLPVALEAALKVKEVARLHAEGMPAAEVKHGPIAMVEPGMPVVVIAPRGRTQAAVWANLDEVRSRGGYVIAIASDGDTAAVNHADEVLTLPAVPRLFTPIVSVVPFQLLAYHLAVVRGLDVDKPQRAAL